MRVSGFTFMTCVLLASTLRVSSLCVSTATIGGPICSSNSTANTIEISGIPSTCECVKLINDNDWQTVEPNSTSSVNFTYVKAFEAEEVAAILYNSNTCSGVIAVVICSEVSEQTPTPAPTPTPSNSTSTPTPAPTSNTVCTRYDKNNAIAISNIDSAVHCVHSTEHQGYAYIDYDLHLAMFANATLGILPIQMYSSPDCSETSLYETINACFENKSAFVYKGSTRIPEISDPVTAAPTSAPTIPGWTYPTKTPSPEKQQSNMFGDLKHSSAWIGIAMTVGLPIMLLFIVLGVIVFRRYRRQLKQVHTYETGQEEVSKGEEFSVQFSEVGEQVSLSVDDLGKVSPGKRRVIKDRNRA